MLEKLWAFQVRAVNRDKTKARFKKRLVMGLREAKRDAKAGKVKCLVVTPNIDDSASAGSLNDQVRFGRCCRPHIFFCVSHQGRLFLTIAPA